MKIITDTFNSNIFGIKMGNIVEWNSSLEVSDVKKVISLAKSDSYQHLNIKVPILDKVTTNSLLQSRFELVDTQLMYRLSVNNRGGVLQNRVITYREYREKDKQQVVNIAESAYVLDQYHSDTDLDNSLCDRYYAEWVNNCCEGLSDKVIVACAADGNVCGYLTLKYEEKEATVILAAVDADYRGWGVFTGLIENTLRMIEHEGKKILHYGTQLANIPVLKTMGRFGGYVEYSNHVLHLKI